MTKQENQIADVKNILIKCSKIQQKFYLLHLDLSFRLFIAHNCKLCTFSIFNFDDNALGISLKL